MHVELGNQEPTTLEIETTNKANIETENQSSVDLEIGAVKEVNLDISEPKPIDYEIGQNKNTSSGTNDHNELTNRDIENQHPIKSIIGLEEALKNAGSVKGVEVNKGNVVDANGIAHINVPRDLGELTNNVGYVNKNSTSLEYYYTKTETDKKINALPLGTVVNIIDTFSYNKRFNNNDIYNANASNGIVDFVIVALLEALNREYFVNINVVVNPLNYTIISADGSYSDVTQVNDIDGSIRCVCQLAGTDIKVFLNLTLLTSTFAYFTSSMKIDLGAGETKYLVGLYIYNSNAQPKIFIDPLQ